MTSDAGREGAAKREQYVINCLTKQNLDHPGHNHVINLHDSFFHEGPNGWHVCLVYKAMGESLSYFQNRLKDTRLPLPLMKRVARQLLQALDHVHSTGFVHTGKIVPIIRWAIPQRRLNVTKDINHKNILTELDDLDVLPMYLESIAKTQQPSATPRTRYDPPVKSLGMRAPKDFLHLNVRLADFGEAVIDDGSNVHLIQPSDCRAPEVILGIGWNSKADIWNLGCIVSCQRVFVQLANMTYG